MRVVYFRVDKQKQLLKLSWEVFPLFCFVKIRNILSTFQLVVLDLFDDESVSLVMNDKQVMLYSNCNSKNEW